MGYDIRVVAFIDILGFKNAIEASNENQKEFDRIFKALSELKEFFSYPKTSYEIDVDRKLGTDTQVLQVSDSLVISRLIQEKGGIYYMLSDCAFAIHLLIENGFLCRGAIKYGYMYHKETMLFGQAFIDAYKSESEEKLPIVKFDVDIFEIVKQFPGHANEGSEDWEIDFLKRDCKRLKSGEYYLDYFTDYDSLVGGGPGTAKSHYLKLKQIIVDGLKLPKESSAYQKYLWASQQFNLTADNFNIDKI